MKRLIKFRGRVPDNQGIDAGKIVFGSLVDYGDGNYRYWINPIGGDRNFPVDPDSVAQLVGFDANGNEVYEGDEVIDEYGNFTIAELQDNLIQPVQLKEETK